MDGLSLDTLKFSTAEHSSYAQVFHELVEFSQQERFIVHDCGDHIALSIPKVRGWLGAKFCTLSPGQIDQVSSHRSPHTTHQCRRHLCVWQILQMTCPQDSPLIRMSRIQFFTALRIAVHAQTGAGAVMKSALKQGTR